MTMTPVKKLAAALSLGLVTVGGLAATPAAAREHYRTGDYYRGYERGYGYDGRDYYRSNRYYKGDRYDRDYRDDRRRYAYCRRDNGTGGAIIGAIAGGLLGNEVAQRGDRTTGAVLGAAVGALAGHAIDKGDRHCR
ncbi:MAG: glycine zipper 2TM domain-containing protein [Sphingobium sp.]